MELSFESESHDKRGKVIFLSYGSKKINIIEIKKGFSRGGHYHTFETRHFLLSGIIEYREKNIGTGKEKVQTITSPATISVPSMVAHLLTAVDDTLFAEEFPQDYSATEYPEYRKIVMQKLS